MCRWIILAVIFFPFSFAVNANWNSNATNSVFSEPMYQQNRTGGVSTAQFFLIQGTLAYVTESKNTHNVCTKYPNVIDDSPILAEGYSLPATSYCDESKRIVTMVEGDAGRFLFERLWKKSVVDIDGWQVDADGFQNAVRKSQRDF